LTLDPSIPRQAPAAIALLPAAAEPGLGAIGAGLGSGLSH